MAGRRSHAELRARMSLEARAAAGFAALRPGEEMGRSEVRRAMHLSQAEIAQTLQITRGSVSKIEQCADMGVSTLRRVIEAMEESWRSWRASPAARSGPRRSRTRRTTPRRECRGSPLPPSAIGMADRGRYLP